MRIAFTDGEMSNLDANFGQLLCAGILEYRPPTAHQRHPWIESSLRVFTLQDYASKRWVDKQLAKQWRDAIEQYDIIVTWNGVRFDLPYLDTRLKRWGLRACAPRRHKDLLYTARYALKLTDAKLDNVAEFLQIYRRYGVRKTRMSPERWTMAMGGHVPSYRYIVHHNIQDLKVLAAVWEELRPFVREIK